jgi:hypothetical protein
MLRKKTWGGRPPEPGFDLNDMDEIDACYIHGLVANSASGSESIGTASTRGLNSVANHIKRATRGPLVSQTYGAIDDPRIIEWGARPNEVANEPDAG